MGNWLSRFIVCERGATAIEYALIAGFIAAVIVAAVNAVGIDVKADFEKVESGF
ncbi:MAG: Flp family type IVb pilin [Alphaproteobacteria bacterium]